MRDEAAGRRDGRIICFGPSELLLEHYRGRWIQSGRGRLNRGFFISSPEPISPTARTSRSTVTLSSAPETSSVDGMGIPARRDKITPYVGDGCQAVVRRLRGLSRRVVS